MYFRSVSWLLNRDELISRASQVSLQVRNHGKLQHSFRHPTAIRVNAKLQYSKTAPSRSRQPPKPWSAAEHETLSTMLSNGVSIEEAALNLGRSYDSVDSHAYTKIRAATGRLNRGNTRRKPIERWLEESVTKLMFLSRDGHTLMEMARAFPDRTAKAITQKLRKVMPGLRKHQSRSMKRRSWASEDDSELMRVKQDGQSWEERVETARSSSYRSSYSLSISATHAGRT